MRIEERTFEKVFGQSMEETSRETCEEGVGARARRVEAVPSRRRTTIWTTVCSGVGVHIV